jgi:adenylate cyclase
MGKRMQRINAFLDWMYNDSLGSSRFTEIAVLQQEFSNLLHTLSSFVKYVPVEVVKLLLMHRAEAVIGVESQEITLFFSDIADFTSISEQIDPRTLIAILSDYLGSVTEIILKSEGTLADYIGDAVVAFWNSPNIVPNHPNVACQAALLQQQCIQKLNTRLEGSGLPKINVRMGLHTGYALCGNIGSGRRLKYTAIGDSVNLTSRLENLNKRYGTRILITSQVYAQVHQDFLCRVLDVVLVKGRRTPTWLFELVSSMKDATPIQKQICSLSSVALACYLNRDFERCMNHLNKIEAVLPGDKTVLLRRKLCQKWLRSPPPSDWTGIEELNEK